MSTLRFPLILAVTALSLAGGAAAQSRPRPAAPTVNWANSIEKRDNGHVLGNPAAPHRLIEFMSYTCSHCAEFARTGDAAIKLAVVLEGKVSFEIRHLLQNPIDLTAALLTHCGGPKRFLGNHEAILSRQAIWLERARKATQAQRTRWTFGTNSARWRAIASDLGFYGIMEARGFNRAQLDRCLADQPLANALANATARDTETFKLRATPSFVLGGKLLDGVHSWDALRPVLVALD
ncbi:thioredoxin domain-containing protein [Qipengyuania sediminis]|uniref:thioredoxin domain-containing protein n=1 Tax=Qipengyuania sediminis TaxID=1532023 RepID=UPI00197DCA6D|nr:thioredoxin domain-containing protein [Qipengyuania sediminis]